MLGIFLQRELLCQKLSSRWNPRT